MKDLATIIGEHPFFAGFAPDQLALIARCGGNVRYQAGDFLGRAGDPAAQFFLLRRGTVALELHVPGQGPFRFDTVSAGEVVGWSWLIPPHTWQFDARAVTAVSAIRFEGACLRARCDADPTLGYPLLKAFTHVLVERFTDTRLQLVDLYGRRN